MQRAQSILLSLLAALTFRAPAQAQNLLSNPEFDLGLGLDTWGGQIGTWVLGADSGGCSDSEAAEGSSALSGGNQYLNITSGCVAVNSAATPAFYVGALGTTTGQVYTRLLLHFFSDSDCDLQSDLGFSDSAAFASGPSSWSHLLGALPVPAEAGSLRVVLDFNPAIVDSPPFTGSFDRIYLGVEPQLLLDGFEVDAGSACRWSSTVP